MTTCLKPNYQRDLHSGEINFSNIRGNNLEELLDNIEAILREGSFSTDLESSQDIDTYEQSIKSMTDTVLEELGKKDLPFEFNRSTKAQIRKYIYSKFLPKPLTQVEQNIQAVIPGTDLISEAERRELRLGQIVSEIYGNNSLSIDSTRQSQFEEEMRLRTIIDTRSRKIIDNNQDLNNGIASYQSEQYKIIYDFLVSQGFDKHLLPISLYRTDSKTQVPNLVRTYYNAMQMMYNLIESKKKDGSLEQELENGWENYVLGRGESALYKAVNAYVNLAYFDDILKNCFGEYININPDYDQPINLVDDGQGSYQEIYKYQFSKGNSNATKNWGVEDHDSLKEMSKFQQVLIKSIPIYDYETRSLSYGRMLPKDFVGSITKLLDVGNQVTIDDEFVRAIDNFHYHPSANLKIIFKRLFENHNNTTLLKQLNGLGLDINNINFLYSIYRTAFKGKNSWASIEEDYTKNKGLTSRYSLISTLIGVKDSNVAMNYTQTSYNHDSGEVETSIKAKYQSNRTKFDIINNVNQTTIDRQNKADLLNRFQISTQNKKDYTITLSIGGNLIKFPIIVKNGGLLDKDFTSKNLIINNIEFPDIDLKSNEQRVRLATRQNLSNEELTFMGILDFIDTMLGTSFGQDSDGLRELNLFLKTRKENFKELFASASRALLVTDIYYQFEQATKEDGTKYSRTELLDFLEKSGIYSDKIQQYKDKSKKLYFIQRFDGYQLSSIIAKQRWLDDLSKTRAILSGDTSKSVISNLDGDKIPNFSPSFLGAKIDQQLARSRERKKASANLLFVNNPRAIKAKAINTDVVTKDGIRKQVKNMTQGELLYDAIINKFIVPILDNNTIFTQPTTYSDKTKFLLYQVSLEALNINELVGDKFNSQVERLIIDTIGQAYKEVYQEVLNDYSLFPEFTTNGEVDLGKVQNWMRTHKEKDIIDLVNSYNKENGTNIVFYKDVHYRQIVGKNLSINELLYEFANNLYTPEKLHIRLEKEKVNFINDLLSNRLSLSVSIKDGELDGVNGNELTRFLTSKVPLADRKKWIKGDKLILGKISGKDGKIRNITYGKVILQEGDVFTINPILNSFFMLDNLIGNNLRYSLTGSEINHKIKALAKLNLGTRGALLYKSFIQKYNKAYKDGTITFLDIDIALRNYTENPTPEEASAAKALRTLYDEQIYKIENGGQNAQFKRNVIIPGTMRYYLQDELNGIRDKMKVAVINDVEANVFNFDGQSSGIDAHDGSAFVNPFSSILENKSLQDCEVGTVKKPIQHWYDDKYMSATLLKYAVDTITNQWMRQSDGNTRRAIVLNNIFKKMTNVRWHNSDGSWRFGEIDLISGCDFKDSPDINFFTDICEGKSLYYRDGLTHKKISNFGVENGVYYTIEHDVDSTGNAPSNEVKVYHYFDNDGTHLKRTDLVNPENIGAHTIDSLYELHKVLGGIYSESVDSEGNLQYSEASNYAVVQFINHVATLKEGADPNVLTQQSYYQPLKQAMIDVLANNSAVKNGAGNINPTSSFYDDTELSYIEIGTDGYGIQMDADHTADEGHMTEFSQVISSLDAGGRLHEYVSQIYETLGRLAIDLSQVELGSIEEFRETGNLTKVYDVVGRTIMNNLSKNRGQAGLANAIIDAIKNTFNLNTDHALDEIKIPFSDPNIYSTILSTFVSIINKKSIKRQYPGLGTVMVPGYDISMIYDIAGHTYQYEDLIQIACEQGLTSTHTDLNLKNRDIVGQLLTLKQNEESVFLTPEPFQPTDNVLVRFTAEKFYTQGLNTQEVEYEVVKEPWAEDANKKDNDLTKRYKDILRIYIKGRRDLGSFDLVKDQELGYYSVHFKTGNADTGETFGSTPEQRNILYENLYRAIPEGAMVSTWGNVSQGGIKALTKLMDEYLGDTKVDNIVSTREVKDREGNTIQIPIFKKFGTGMFDYDTNFEEQVSLNSIEDYYQFKENPVAFLAKRGYYNISNIQYQKDVLRPRNLAPVKISWEYDDETGHHYMNIFDHWAVKSSFNGKRDVKAIQKAFDDLEKGVYYRSPEDTVGVRVYHMQDGVRVEGANNQPAEIIMSNLYKTKFGLRNGDSLSDIINRGPSYFIRSVTPVISDSYDVVYTKQDGKNLYITFKPLQDNSESFDSTRRSWKNKIKEDFEYPENYSGSRNIIHRVFTATKDNIKLFEVGREILREDIQYDKDKRKFVDRNGRVLKNQSRFSRFGEDKVLEYIEFISNNQVTEIREKTSKYDLYNINRDNIAKVLVRLDYTQEQLTRVDKTTGETYTITPDQKFDEEVNGFISKLLSDVYHTRDFNGMQINSQVTKQSAWIMQRVFNGLSNSLGYDKDLSEYVKSLKKVLDSGVEKDGMIMYSARSRSRALGAYSNLLAQKQYTSFLKSQYFTVSRIPAQTLQSFMQMRNVGFTGTLTNQCFVSHWQTWLQGSDYDIDKAYVMGLSFDGNGRYVGWSSLFKYSSNEALRASEYLPMPKRKVYIKTESGYNIDTFISDIIQSKTDTEEVLGYVKLLNFLNQNNISEISYTIPEGVEVQQAIANHEFTKVPYSLQEDANKNFVSSHIQNTVQNLRNMIGAYSPIEMEAFRAASEASPKGEQSSKMTLLNPSTKLLMQYQNITGKNVIGIAANGEKASFMWHYYINDILRHPTDQSIQYSQFSFKTTRLQGRAKGAPVSQEVNTLPDVNFEGIDPQIASKFGTQLTGNITVDLMISQVLSAATDNAKELILAKVNAGNKLAKMYLFLITLGFDINDIVKFMTSPAVSFIDAITEANIFTGQDTSIKDAINLARGDFNGFYKNFMSNITIGKLPKDIRNKLNSGQVENIKNEYSEGSLEYIELNNAIESILEIKMLKDSYIQSEIEERKKNSSISEAQILEQILKEIPQDIDEFENVMEGANEFSNLGRILGFNQGLPTSKEDLQSKIQFIQNILSTRINEYKPTTGEEDLSNTPPLDVRRYFTDSEYAQEIKDLYQKVKKCINIFDIIDRIPQFNAIFKIFSAVVDIDHNISLKTRIYDAVYDQLKQEVWYMSEQWQKRLLKGIDDFIIARFVNKSQIQIPYKAGSIILNDLRQAVTTKEDGVLRFNSLGDVASFKYLFENSIIPALKEGIIYDYNGTSVVEIQDASLSTNKFIQSLIRGDNKGIPLYKCNIDMMTIDNSQLSKIKFQSYIKGLQQLQKIKINNGAISLADLFVLYNLIVNKDQYGSDRMTTLFDTLVQGRNELSLIKKYLTFVGDMDYTAKVDTSNGISVTYKESNFQINVTDLMAQAAAIVNSDIGQKDPTIIVNTESGPELRIKSGKGYSRWHDLVPRIEGETQDEYLSRIYYHNSYFVLGGSYQDLIEQQISSLRTMDSNALTIINQLIQQGVLNIYKVCQ